MLTLRTGTAFFSRAFSSSQLYFEFAFNTRTEYYRVYSPVAFGKKQKNSTAYVRKFVPEVADLPDKYLLCV